MNEYYKLKFPLQRVINFMEGDIIINTQGDIFQVDENYIPIQILDSPLHKEFTVKGLNEKSQLLFIRISNNMINDYFYLKDC